MALSYPNWNASEYTNINPTAAVDCFLRLREIDAEIKAREAELEDATLAAKSRGKAVADAAVEAVTAYDPAPERSSLPYLVSAFQSSRRLNLLPAADTSLIRFADAARRAFSTFDEAAFREWHESTYSEELKTDFVKAKASAEGKLKKAKDERRKLLCEASNSIFRDHRAPAAWRTYRVSESAGFTNVDLTEVILKSFVADWHARFPLFHERTTVAGVEIASLPDPAERKAWVTSLEKLGFDRLEKRPALRALRAA